MPSPRRRKRQSVPRSRATGLTSSGDSRLEEFFVERWAEVGRGISLEREYPPVPGRRYRLDFAHPQSMVGVEVNGGTWSRKRGGHSSGAGIQRDYEKINLCQLAGWTVIQLDSKMITGQVVKKEIVPDYWLLAIADLIESRIGKSSS